MIEEVEQQLSKPEIFQDYEKSQELNQQLEATNNELETLLEEWEGLQTN